MTINDRNAAVATPLSSVPQVFTDNLQIERGPDWLFVRLAANLRQHSPQSSKRALADGIWEALQENHAHRVLLELDQVDTIDDDLITMITALAGRVRASGGMMRLCGLSEADARTLRARGGAGVAHFDSRAEAVGAPKAVGVS